MGRARVAIVFPELGWGGADAVGFWTVEALKEKYEVTFITCSTFSVSDVNQFHGTSLRDGEFDVMQVPVAAVLRMSRMLNQLKHHLTMRFCKSVSSHFDLLISAYNEMDFGCNGIQYIHFPVLPEELIIDLGQFPDKWYYRRSLPRRMYRRLSQFVSGLSLPSVKKNMTLVNSHWTGEVVKRVYGIRSRTIYPPVLVNCPDTPWQDREDGFVCIGRLVPQKRVDAVIRILQRVRKSGWHVHLHIVGDSQGATYQKAIERMQAENSSWVSLERALSRQELLRLIARHKYGIHGMPNEHFGIAVAELVKAGCITFVPSGGGQEEIVGHPGLVYEGEAAAVAKIVTALSDRSYEESLRSHLRARSAKFTTDRFMLLMREAVAEGLGQQNRGLSS